MVDEIRDHGFLVSKDRVERFMRDSGIRARHTRRYRVTTDIEVFFNRSRRHSTLDNMSPARCLQDWITTQHWRNLAA